MTSTPPDAVVADGLVKQFGEVHALQGVSFAVPTGTVLGLLGPNGAGKTTAVHVLTTLLAPDRGRAEVLGFDVVEQPEQVRASIGWDVKIAPDVAATPAPSAEELRLIREELDREGAYTR